MKDRLLLLCGCIACVLSGAFIASRVMHVNDPVVIKKNEIMDYLFDTGLIDRVYDTRHDKVAEFESLLDRIEKAKTVEALDTLFGLVKRFESRL